MNILIIGGTRFQGPFLVSHLLDAGHAVTIFHRGNHYVQNWPNLTSIIGDREHSSDLALLSGRHYDVCIDNCAYNPSQIKLLSRFINTDQYYLISTVYVYKPGYYPLTEDSPTLSPADQDLLTPTIYNYGTMKALCEQQALLCFGSETLIIRPTIMIGPNDHTERLLFWCRLAAIHGKRIDIVSDNPMLQLIDVRDLANFIQYCIEHKKKGRVNLSGPQLSLSALLDLVYKNYNGPLDSISLSMSDLPRYALSNLPYCSHPASCYDSSLSLRLGCNYRSLSESIYDIYHSYVLNNFKMTRFIDEELSTLRLFA